MSVDRRQRTGLLVLAGLVLFTYAYFYQAGGWGQNVRFNLVRAIVEQHRLTIDSYHQNSGDKAQFQGHYYLDKPPGVSLTAVPFVAASHAAMKLVGVPPASNRGVVAGSYVATIFAASLPAVIAALAVWWVALALGATMGGALFAAAVLAIGSPYFTYATVLWSYGLAGAGLVVAFAAAVALRTPGAPRRDLALGATVGLAAGWATLSELNCGVAAVILTVLVAIVVGPRRWPRVIGGLALGAAVTATILLGYNKIVFGAAHNFGYDNVNGEFGFEENGRAVYGLVKPRASILWNITFGRQWGLFPLAPVLLAAPVGYALWIRDRATRTPAIVGALIVAMFVFLNTCLIFWTGGGNFGPRHLGPSLPLLALGLAPVWSRLPRWGKVVAGTLAAWGLVAALVVVSTHVIPPPDDPRGPLPQAFSHFAAGELSWCEHAYYYEPHNWQYPPDPNQVAETRDAWNLGELVGLGRGWHTLIPLALAWIGGLLWWRRRGRLDGAR